MGVKTICILRHGESFYKQGIVSSGLENDLTATGIEKVTKTATILKDELAQAKVVGIYSSPVARAKQTADIVKGLVAQGQKIEIRSCLAEQKNYSWSTMKLLVLGGKMKIDGVEVEVNPDETNPDRKNVQDFGTEDIAKINGDVWQKNPNLARLALSIEPSKQVAERMRRFVVSLASHLSEEQAAIVVTHDASIRTIVKPAGIASIEPGDRVILAVEHGQILVKNVAEMVIARQILY